MASNPANPQQPTRLMQHFSARSVEDHGSGWSALWDSNDSDLWDRGKPSPALVDIIEQQRDTFSPLTGDGRRKRALVPGCGRGYDAVMLALHGWEAYGLEISATGVSEAKKYAETETKNPQGYNFGSGESESVENAGRVSFVEGDFFQSDWESVVSTAEEVQFDLVYDYTFLCALHPDMRSRWADRMAQLVRPGGMLVCLEFPMYKDPALSGPPWGLKGVHWDLLARGGNGVVNIAKEEEDPSQVEALGGLFWRAQYFRPSRSYESGKGTDMLSVYARK